jgi:phytoene synthase
MQGIPVMININEPSWELKLLTWAYEPLQSKVYIDFNAFSQQDTIPVTLLARAYQECASITRTHSQTFFLASSLLPAEKRKAVRALYAFCRINDDIVDRDQPGFPILPYRQRDRGIQTNGSPESLACLAWDDTRRRYAVPEHYANQLLDGVAQDLYVRRYSSFDELAAYCYFVASTVGLMAMHIIGFSGATPRARPEGLKAIPYAVKLGVALQLTNILRDVNEDWKAGRVYLPTDELEAFNLSEHDIRLGIVDSRWRTFLQFQIDRNRRLYREATPGIRFLDVDGQFAVAAAARLYEEILTDIERHDYDVFHRRAYVNVLRKVVLLSSLYLDFRKARNIA